VPRYVALLRGINLGSQRRVSMPRLRATLGDAGYGSVGTVAQSGNLVLTSDARPEKLERNLAKLLKASFGFEIAVLIRTRDELADVIANDPFAGEADDAARYQVSFLSADPDSARIAELERAAVAPERVAVRGREIYAWHPGGVGRSPLAKLMTEHHLGVGVTARNWRTLGKLLALAEGSGP
jgi:uncharacterized protein (DUF1697 family)